MASLLARLPTRPKDKGRLSVINKGKSRGEVWLYGPIGLDWFGDGVTAKAFADEIKKLGKVTDIDLHVNSDGGVVTDARAMYNLLVQHEARITTHIDGIAASAASLVAMAGDEIEIAEGGFIMVHNARGVTIGDAVAHREVADVLDQFDATLVDTYAARTKQDKTKIKKWMSAETWFTGREAVENGFADRMIENLSVAASLTHGDAFSNVPLALRPNRARALAQFARRT